jgi:hypothetical protein
VCEFLGVAFSSDTTEFYKTDEAKRAADASGLWENVTKPVMKDNTRKFVSATSPDDLRIFESVAGRSLDALGYERVLVKKGEETQFTPEQIAAFDAENERLKAAMWEKLPAEDRRRRAEQKAVVDAIVARNSGLDESPAAVSA